MSQTYTQVPPDSTGNKIDTFATGGTGHQRQAIVIADPNTDGDFVQIGSDGLLPVKTEQMDFATNTTSTVAQSTVGLVVPGTNGPVAVSPSNPLPISGSLSATISNTTFVVSNTTAFNVGAANIATTQISVTTTSTVIVASRATRRGLTIVQLGTGDVYISGATATTTGGILLLGTKGAAITLCVTGTISGITTTGSSSVSVEEEYD